MFLETIESPADLKNLDERDLPALCDEIRQFIIEQVSTTGGHLASNLGVVELTIVLHYLFDSPKDKLVWDVGHQSYTHKIITGRRKTFSTLRQSGGISGFPRPAESGHDAFIAGHSSTSISAALGLVEARDRSFGKSEVIAIIGDGSMTAGLAFEGLNHAGHLKKDLIVILNDNEMSISKNVGALSSYLNRVLTASVYKKFKGTTRELMEKMPFGQQVSKAAQKMEVAVKGMVLPGMLFEDLGFKYTGPLDGHDLPGLMAALRAVKEEKGPRLVHVITKKGKGYVHSEDDPCNFHGVGPFEVETGNSKPSSVSYSEYFGQALARLAEKDPRIVAVTAAMKQGTGLAKFEELFPERVYDVGIAEPHAVVFSAAMAKGGLRPVVAIYSTFLQRGYDELIHDVCLQNLPVVFAIDRAGVVGEDGPTHHGLYDISYLRHIPGMTVMAPKDAPELEEMLKLALTLNGPSAIRYPRGKAVKFADTGLLELGKAEKLREGEGLAILAVGNMVPEAAAAADELSKEGISASVYNMRFIKPLDMGAVKEAAGTGRIVTVKDNSVLGGFGGAVCEALFGLGLGGVSLKIIGFPDKFIEHASQAEQKARNGVDKNGIIKAAKDIMK